MAKPLRIPFSILPSALAARVSRSFLGFAERIKSFFPYLELNLQQAQMSITPLDYLALCLVSSIIFFIFILFIGGLALYFFAVENFSLIAPLGAFIISFFVFWQQIFYPRLLAGKRIRELERNLLPALRTMLIQLNAGVVLFDIFVSISNQDYGEISAEFKRIVRRINSGFPTVQALDASAANNPSMFYRRAIWQIVNGMKAGSDITTVLKEVIDGLSKEQIIQIETYGSRLNPLAMFYMIIAVILPSLSMTLLIVMSSLIALPGNTLKVVFFGLYIFVLFFQVMFLGMIKTRRPNLIGE